jgi:hypothetical protein
MSNNPLARRRSRRPVRNTSRKKNPEIPQWVYLVAGGIGFLALFYAFDPKPRILARYKVLKSHNDDPNYLRKIVVHYPDGNALVADAKGGIGLVKSGNREAGSVSDPVSNQISDAFPGKPRSFQFEGSPYTYWPIVKKDYVYKKLNGDYGINCGLLRVIADSAGICSEATILREGLSNNIPAAFADGITPARAIEIVKGNDSEWAIIPSAP